MSLSPLLSFFGITSRSAQPEKEEPVDKVVFFFHSVDLEKDNLTRREQHLRSGKKVVFVDLQANKDGTIERRSLQKAQKLLQRTHPSKIIFEGHHNGSDGNLYIVLDPEKNLKTKVPTSELRLSHS